jgi:hypothetical protein
MAALHISAKIPHMPDDAFDLSEIYVHLGLGSTTVPVPDFGWTQQDVMRYLRKFASDRDEGRLVGIVPATESWSRWERHTGGDELVVQISGCSDVIQDIDGNHHTIRLMPGQAMINPRNVWHTSDVHQLGQSLFIAAGRKTEYRPRSHQN